MSSLNQLTIEQAHQGLVKKEFSSKELTRSCLDRIKKIDSKIDAFLTLTPDLALKQAEEADKRIKNGEVNALTGIPLAIKDNILIKDEKCTAASKILENYVATYSATVIDKLEEAGAVFLGKTNLDEFGMGSSTENSAFKKTKNPWDLSRVPGGSSGGSAAAVASDECLGALGSDTGSSVRLPASFCGVVGLLPTYGRVSRYGLIAMTSSLDQIGPIGKTVKDTAILFQALNGLDSCDSTTVNKPNINLKNLEKDIKGLKVGVPKEFFIEGMDPKVEEYVEKAIKKLEELGANIVEVSLPLSKYALAVYYITVFSEVSTNLARYDGIRYGLSNQSGKNLMEIYLKTKAAGFGDEAKRRIILGTYALSAGYYDQYYLQAQKLRYLIREDFRKVFQSVDCLATPVSPSVAFKIGEKFDDPLTMYLSDIFTVSANIAGITGISIPCGFVNNLPVGLQLICKSFDEETIFRLAYHYEKSTDWLKNKPKL